MTIRVLVGNDDPIFRAGLGALLEKEPDVSVIGESPGGDEALEAARRLGPDVTLLSTSRSALDSMHPIGQATGPGTDRPIKVILLLTAPRHGDVLRALSAGFRGVLPTNGSPDELLHAIRLVAAGEACVAPATISTRLADLSQAETERQSTPPKALAVLTAREREVFRVLARGISNTEIARELSLSGATVRSHVHHVLAKLGLQSRAQAVAFAYDIGFVRPRLPG